MKKILFVVEAMGGGVFTYIVSLSKELADYFQVTVAYSVRRQTPEDFGKYFDERIELIRVKNFVRRIEPGKDIAAFKELKDIARQVRPDIIHMHSSKAGAIGRFAFNGFKYRLFYSPHGYSFLMKNYSTGKRLLFKAIERAAALTRCTTISVSEGEHRETLKFTHRAFYVNNGIDINELERELRGDEGRAAETERSNSNKEFIVYTLGRICYQKNPELFNDIALSCPEIHFKWVGDGDARHLLTAPNIEVTGWLNRGEALRRSMSGSVFILTSLWEGMPMSLLEAMYLKKLCIVSDCIGNTDVVEEGENGYICKSAEAYASLIRQAKNNPKGFEEIREHAKKDVMLKFNSRVMAQGYKDIYERALCRGYRRKPKDEDMPVFGELCLRRDRGVS